MNYAAAYKFGTEVSYVFRAKILPFLRNKKVLDFGCGTGEYLKNFSNDSLGLDISPKILEEARKRGLRARRFDLNNPTDLGETFEAVFLSHVLEHAESPLNLLRFANKCLIDGGQIVISIPNEISFINLKYPYFTGDGNHLYSFSVSNMKELLTQTGFTVDHVYYDYYTLFTQKWGLNRFLSLLDHFPPSLRTPFAWAFWFIGKNVGSN